MKIVHLTNDPQGRAAQLIQLLQAAGHEASLVPHHSALAMAAYLRQTRPAVLHVHESTAIPRLVRPLLGQLGIGVVRTLSELPAHWLEGRSRFWRKRQEHELVSTPSRAVQYRLLVEAGWQATYIPDGYEPLAAEPVPLTKLWGLRRRQYGVAMTDSLAELTWMVQAHAQSGTARKLVYPAFRYTSRLHHLQQVFPSFRVVKIDTPQQRVALVRNAALVLFGTTLPHQDELLFQAMDAARPIVAVNTARTAELLGTGGLYVKALDLAFLAQAIPAMLREEAGDNARGAKAQTRAQQHFQWSGIIKEYVQLYRRTLSGPAVPVPVDSALPQDTAGPLAAGSQQLVDRQHRPLYSTN